MTRSDDVVDRVRAHLGDADLRLIDGDVAGSRSAREEAHRLLDEAVLTMVSFDPDARRWTFGHRSPGPAGAASVYLSHGVLLSVDFADRDRVLAVRAPADGGAAPVVAAVVGRDAGALVEAVESNDGFSGPDLDFVPFPGPDPRTQRALARLAVLDDARERAEDEDAAWPLWSAEAAWLCEQAASVPGMHERARAEAIVSVRTVARVARTTVKTAVKTRLAELLPTLRQLVDSDGDRQVLSDGMDHLGTSEPNDRRSPITLMRAAIRHGMLPKGHRPVRLHWAGVPLAPAARGEAPGRTATFKPAPELEDLALIRTIDSTATRSRDGALLTVRCPVAASELDPDAVWARVFTKSALRLLDSAPLEVEDPEGAGEPGVRYASAQLRVPPSVATDDLALDITDSPDEPIRESDLWHLERALALGRAAACSARLGRHAEAADQWRESAEHWRNAGNVALAEEAQRRSQSALHHDLSGSADASPFLAELQPPDADMKLDPPPPTATDT